MNSPFTLKHRVVFITGANRGIGKAIAETLLNYGVEKVYLAVRDLSTVADLETRFIDRVTPIFLDLNEPNSIFAAAANAQDVDLVINNAGILNGSNPLAMSAIDSLQHEFDINVFGLVRMAQAFAPLLKHNGGGAFVQLNSIASLRSVPEFATYAASKAAAYSLTQAIRHELSKQNTVVLSVHPGPVATAMAKSIGLVDAEPATVVAEAIINALEVGEPHVFPDSKAQQLWAEYESFARNVIETI
jgi:short-subunit dehydrogenase